MHPLAPSPAPLQPQAVQRRLRDQEGVQLPALRSLPEAVLLLQAPGCRRCLGQFKKRTEEQEWEADLLH